jgi:hypothetical protein
MSVISRAKELVKHLGKDKAIEVLQAEIEKYNKPYSFEDICLMSGKQTAIDFIKEKNKT